MSVNKTANIRMEEGYMRATIQYDESAYKAEICKAISELEGALKIYPEVIHRYDNETKGFSTVEFSGDDYVCDRTCGKFIQDLLCKLEIGECIAD
ncbi:MAG TPA: hypothetical protein ENK86_06285 [Campylobacterales bacterium]|nr:hypothetical protein [Campylobacterales bacterium]